MCSEVRSLGRAPAVHCTAAARGRSPAARGARPQQRTSSARSAQRDNRGQQESKGNADSRALHPARGPGTRTVDAACEVPAGLTPCRRNSSASECAAASFSDAQTTQIMLKRREALRWHESRRAAQLAIALQGWRKGVVASASCMAARRELGRAGRAASWLPGELLDMRWMPHG